MPNPVTKTTRSKPILYVFMAIALLTLALGIVMAFRAPKAKAPDNKTSFVLEKQNRE
jgi:hypothetical protein